MFSESESLRAISKVILLELGLVLLLIVCNDPHAQKPRPAEVEMNPIFQLAEGIEVKDLSGIREAFSIRRETEGDYFIQINVSSPNIIRVFRELAAEVNEPGFFLVEVGSPEEAEKQIRKKESDPFHKDVYYLDGKNWKDISPIIVKYQYLLSQDGGVNYGFGSHSGRDEVFVTAYKIFHIYADEPSKYIKTLLKLGFKEVDSLRTVWDNFTIDMPGRRNVLTHAKPNIWAMIENLKKDGLYFAERRED